MTTTYRILPGVLFSVLLLALTGACGDSGGVSGRDSGASPDPATTRVEVHFIDSSVPPRYHRSWDLSLDDEQIHLVVDSYGDVIAEETVTMPAELWTEFVDDLEESLADLDGAVSPSPGCAGGRTMELNVMDAGEASAKVSASTCGSNPNRKINDEIYELVAPFTELVDLDKHTRT